MLLRFVGERAGSGPMERQCPLIVGEAYEVVEIFEMPWHLMARRPGDSRWPRPGDSMFGLHPEMFEAVDSPIPIVSCGYTHHSFLDSFGTMVEGAGIVEKLRQFEDLTLAQYDRDIDPMPDKNESYDQWYARIGYAYGSTVGACVYEVGRDSLGLPAIYSPDDVVLGSAGTGVPFALCSYSTFELIAHDISKDAAQGRIMKFLRTFSVDGVVVRLLNDVQFWTGDGSPRLIQEGVFVDDGSD